MKTLTDFCKTVETGVDPRLSHLFSFTRFSPSAPLLVVIVSTVL